MRKPILKVTMSLLVVFSMASCEKGNMNEQMVDEPIAATATMNASAELQKATDVIASMVAENAEYLSFIDAAINDKNLEYMEDRVLFKDLFTNNVESANAAVATRSMSNVSSFADDFARFANGNAMYAKAMTDGEQMSADKLMDYLVENNISIYCPFPLDMYDEDNRIPAITTVVNPGEEAMPGIQYYADGTSEEVMVDQAYADEHPVWIIRHEDDYIFDASNSRNKTLAANGIGGPIDPNNPSITKPGDGTILPPGGLGAKTHYEMSIGSIYCTEYMGPLGDGDLSIYLCFCESNPIYDTKDEIFKGSFDRIIPVKMPRKYVMDAKANRARGWFPVGCVFETDWQPDEYEKYFAAYEYDPKVKEVKTRNFNTSFTVNAALAKMLNLTAGMSYGANIVLEYYSKDDLMGLMKWDRVWIQDILKNGGATWTHYEQGVRNTDRDGLYLIKPAQYFWVSVKQRVYYSDGIIDMPYNPQNN